MTDPARTSALIAALVAWTAPSALASDHLDAPVVSLDGRVDINDVYVFRGTDPSNAVFIMTVNPGAGVTNGFDFDPGTRYEIVIDTDQDLTANLTYSFTFENAAPGRPQQITLSRSGGQVHDEILARGPVGEQIPVKGGGVTTADVFDDPFYFDLVAFQNSTFTDPGTDFFAGLNVTALVLEVPSVALGAPFFFTWARTVQNGVQVDRVGKPAINTVLIPTGKKDAFNAAQPRSDVPLFKQDVINTITQLSGDPLYADQVAAILMPDILFFDAQGSQQGFPISGRRLDDDVIDIELALLTMGAVLTDGVAANDVPFPGSFPYLAPAH